MSKLIRITAYCLLAGLLAVSTAGTVLAHGPGPESGQRPPDMMEHITNNLKDLVSDGTISQEESDKILGFFEEKDARMKADFEKTKDMTPEERREYFDKNRPKDCPDMVKDLMNAAGLSEDQAKKVAGALRPPKHPGREQGQH